MKAAVRRVLAGVWLLWVGLTFAAEDPEKYLIKTLQALQAGQIDQAREKAETLRRRFPNYPMGKVLSVELNGRLAGDKVILKKLHAWHQDTVHKILAEASVRWRHAEQTGQSEQWVHNLILSPGQQRWWVVVDLSASRLYLFENRDGALTKVLDTYVSKGAAGIGKQRKGDQRTPVGLYRITAWRAGAELPPIYGDGALVLDYPNPWDRFVGRTGSGIWLHGTPPELYARPPASSKGCVVLSNAALDALRQHLLLPRNTPVLLVDSVRALTPPDPAALIALLKRTQARSRLDSLELVRYPGEKALYYVAWQGHGGLHAQFWQVNGPGGLSLALEQTIPAARDVRLAEKQPVSLVR